jgi:hypothetical protein
MSERGIQMRLFLLSVTLSFLGAALQAATVSSTFEAGLDGWTADGAVLAAADRRGPGGEGDGYMLVIDNAGGAGTLFAPRAYLGDLGLFDGGLLSIDFVERAKAGSAGYVRNYGVVTLRSGARRVSADLIPTDPRPFWQSAALDFTAATFGATQTDWAALLSAVSSFEIFADSWGNISEVNGLDNITLRAPDPAPMVIPLPASMLMLLTALGGLALAPMLRRRT